VSTLEEGEKMKALVLSDVAYMNAAHQMIIQTLTDYLASYGMTVETETVSQETITDCIGCFGCWTKTPGECAIQDDLFVINRKMMLSDFVVYLCPIVYGQCAANMKTAIDRWLPNMLPFFITRRDGSTMHPARYESYPSQLMIGYSDHFDESEAQLFSDITLKHREGVQVVLWHDSVDGLLSALDKIELKRVEGRL
jgi:multimeric flavodoxin WrbA